jgi:cobalamin biosynthesis protein CbiD
MGENSPNLVTLPPSRAVRATPRRSLRQGLRDLSMPTEKSESCKISVSVQGCQMVCFQTKNPNLGKFWMGLAM